MEIKELLEYTKSLKILFVEDDKNSREEISQILNRFFKKVIVAEDGVEGLEKFKTNKIDLVITDITMPRLNGLDMLIKIKDINPDIQSIILSAYNETDYFINAILLGVNGFLLKPFVLEQFTLTLEHIYKNIRYQKEAQTLSYLLTQYQEIVDNSMIVCKFDQEKNITYVNDKFLDIFAFEDITNKKFNEIFYDEDIDKIYESINNKQVWNGVLKNKTSQNELLYTKIIIKPILDEDKNIIEFIALFMIVDDILEQKKLLLDYIEYNNNVLVGIISILDFNNIRNYYGEKIAVEINFHLEKLLKKYLPKEIEHFYNLNNGEFAIAINLENINPDEIIENLKQYQSIINKLNITIDNLIYNVNIIISVSNTNNALEDAYIGLKQLKKSNKTFIQANGIADKIKSQAKNNLKIINILKESIKNNGIKSYYQAIIDNKTKQIIKYESLVRIEYNNKIYLPYQFLDVAKHSVYYYQITEIMIKNAFNLIKQLKISISVNLSEIDIAKENIREIIYKLLEKNKEYAKYLTFELLEDENIEDESNIFTQFIEKVKNCGVSIAIDDFGSGYSNFIRISQFKPDIIKIDGSLIKNINKDEYSYNLVKSMVEFARLNKIQTVAEFVENEEIFNIVKNLGIDFSQGYYFEKPKKEIK